MTFIEDALSHPLAQSLGWTLVHFTWQATGIALLLAVTLALLGGATAKARYAAACLAMILMVLAPAATLCRMQGCMPAGSQDVVTLLADSSEPGTAPPPMPARWIDAAAAGQEEEASPAAQSTVPVAPSWRESASRAVGRALPGIVLAWAIGVLVLALRNLGGFVQLQLLKHRQVRPLSQQWQRRAEALAHRLSVRHEVRIVESQV